MDNLDEKIKEILESLCTRIRNQFPNSIVFYSYDVKKVIATIHFRKMYYSFRYNTFFSFSNKSIDCLLDYRVSLEILNRGIVEAQYTFDEIRNIINLWEKENLLGRDNNE